MKVAMLGAGAFGSTLGGVLADNGYEVIYYDLFISDVKLDEAVDSAELMVLCVPSNATSDLLLQLPKNIPLVVATKGFLNDACFSEFTDWMVLSGPGFAADIKAKKDTSFTITDHRLEEWFKANYLHFDYTDDSLGVLMCGALKNVYAILAGIKELERDSDPWQKYITEVSGEMQALLSLNQADPLTFNLNCGKGDLKLTCGMPSRNYEFGYMIAKGQKIDSSKTVEGLSTLERIKQGEIKIPESAKNLRDLISGSEAWS